MFKQKNFNFDLNTLSFETVLTWKFEVLSFDFKKLLIEGALLMKKEVLLFFLI